MDQKNRPTTSLFVGLLLAILFSTALNYYFVKQQHGTTPQQQPQQAQAEAMTPRPIAEAMQTKGLSGKEAAGAEIKKLQQEVAQYPGTPGAAWSLFRKAYLQETILKEPGKAKKSYEVLTKDRKYTKNPYAPTAAFRRADLIWKETHSTDPKEGKKEFEYLERLYLVDQSKVKSAPILSPEWFTGIFTTPPQSQITFPDGHNEPIMLAVCDRIEPLNQKDPLYKVIDSFVSLCGRNRHYSYAIAIILFGVIIKLLLQPLNSASFKSMREMQKVQPEMKKIQDKYKGANANPQKMNQEVMALYKAHGVNPMGGCLPILIQMPVLILLYRAIMSYRCQFNGADFLWVDNLALPDMPLLILYGVSMIITTKLTTMPTADPAQQQQQKMMAWMMPIMFVMICRSFPAAFILYWMTFNFMQTVQQLALYRKWDREEGKESTGLKERIKTLNPFSNTPLGDSNVSSAPEAAPPASDKPSSSQGASSGQRRRRRKKK